MPRPPDTYTHAQFETVESDHQGETVQCIHCQRWTGSVKTLNRKKDHLLKCPAYAVWRAAGNGQDLAPANRYNKRDSSVLDASGVYGDVNYAPNGLPPPPRNKLHATDLSNAFEEFWDDVDTQRCIRARCKYCGAVRAKNTTRQYEHLQNCQDFLNSAEGQRAQANGTLQMANADGAGHRDIWRGGAPNPNLSFQRPKQSRPSGVGPSVIPQQQQQQQQQLSLKPSLIQHLMSKNRAAIEEATQIHFLSHAGCGTLSQPVLRRWLCQQSHLSRALTTFIGSVIGKIRLPATETPQADTAYRAFDLLVSALNNAKRELDFLRTTQQTYGLSSDSEEPKQATKGFIDLFASAASPAASLLEALVVLWAIEHLYNTSWLYARTFYQPTPLASTSYSLPSYLQPGQPNANGIPFANNSSNNTSHENGHVAALHLALIPNWTSVGFSNFVEACRSIVDEVANSQTTGSGAAELNVCEVTFRQICWLWRQYWPEVTGMGEHDEEKSDPVNGAGRGGDGRAVGSGNRPAGRVSSTNGFSNPTNGNTQNLPSRGHEHDGDDDDVDDDGDDNDDDDDDAEEGVEVHSNGDENNGENNATRGGGGGDGGPQVVAASPFGGTGLGAVAAANRAS